MKFKRLIAVISMAVMAMAMTACGGEKQSETDNNNMAHQITGSVVDADGSTMVIQKDDSNLTFNYEGVDVQNFDDREFDLGEDAGDVAIITYTGKINGDDASKCQVSKIAIMPDQEKRMKCEFVDIVSTRSMMTVNDGTQNVVIDVSDAERHYKDGLKAGDQLEIAYLGEINGADTKNALIRAVYDQDTKYDQNAVSADIEEVNESVWTKAPVNVREGSSTGTEIVSSLKASKKLTRTGIVSDGWSQIEYEGGEGYVLTSMLAKKKPAKDKFNVTAGTINYMTINESETSMQFNADGRYYNIDISDAELHFINGNTTGTPVELIYKGDVLDGVTAEITVKSLQSVITDNN